MTLKSSPTGHSAATRRFVLAQIAVQVGMALTPFWALTVQAAITPERDDRFLSSGAQAASGLAQAHQSGNAAGYFSQQATSAASAQAQQWLQNFGTARVELGTDDRFKPRTGAADLLVPLYKSDERLFFTQNGIRNLDGQFTGNFGLGQRHFTGDWMLGYNAFYDQNFSHGHKRVGTGVEAWRDYLKLSGNGYWRVSGWKNAVDVEDYDARPANGFDLRAEAWLPAWPSLGGRLMYEKYYGNEVALFGKDQRQKNPGAVTAGLSYTPVPLVSLSADHKRGGSQNETRFGLEMNWQIGQPLAAQIDPAAVSLQRTLAGSGMDLVERNNNIVLEYRKKQLIDLVLPKEISGVSGRAVPVAYKLASKYALDKIVWNDAALLAAGGKVEDLGSGGYQVVLPTYVAGAMNEYALSGVAYDVRGNGSKTASTRVIVARPAVSTELSSVSAAPEIILANGTATSVVTVTLVNEDGTPATGLAAELAAAVQDDGVATARAKAVPAPAAPATLGDVTEQGDGVYTLQLTAGTRPSVVTISAALSGVALQPVTVKQISDASTGVVADDDLLLLQDGVVADGVATNRAQARVTDATGNPVAGVTVTFTLSGTAQAAAGSSLTGVSDDNGFVTLAFSNVTAEAVTVTATTAGGGSAQATATFIADSASAKLADGSLSADRSTALANGSDSITYSAQVQDANGNPVASVSVSWNADGGSLSRATSVTDKYGRATIGLTSLKAVAVVVNAALNGSSLTAAPVNFTADAGNLDAGKSVLAAVPATIIANGAAASVITLSLKDVNDNPVSGQSVTFTSDLAGSSVSAVTDNGDGSYTAKLTGIKAGDANVSVSVAGVAFGVTAAVTLVADGSNLDAGKSVLAATPSSIVADGVAASQITLSLKDVNDNPVRGQNITFNTTLAGSTVSTVTDNGDGSYTAQLTGTTAGSESITVSVGGAALGVAAATVTLTADAGNLDAAKSALAATPATIVADGAAASVITLSLKDRNDNPVSGQTVTFSSSLGGSSVGAVTDNGDGTYRAQLTGTSAGAATISASVNGTAFGVAAAAVTLTADASNLDAGKSALAATPATIVANGAAASVITLSLKDRNDNPVSGLNVIFNTQLGGSRVSAVTDNGDGTYKAQLTGTMAGSESISVSVNGASFGVTAAAVTLTADSSNLDASKSALGAVPATIVADGAAASQITLYLKDVNNNPVSGQSVTFSSTLGGSSVGAVTDNGDGSYTAQLTGTTAGSESITASVNGTALGTTAAAVTLTADSSNPDVSKSSLTATPAVILADNIDNSALVFSLKDRNGNPISGQTVTFTSSLAGSTVSSVTDKGDGTYSATLSSTWAGTADITVNLNGTSFNRYTSTVRVNPVPVDLTLAIDSPRKNIGETIQLTVTAKRKGTSTLAPNTKVTFTAVNVVNRQNVTVTSGEMMLNGIAISTFAGVTNANGQLVIAVTDPAGTGVKTKLQITAESGDVGYQEVIFNVKTSPDLASANMYGHMTNTLTVNGMTFHRPYLKSERSGSDELLQNNENWSLHTYPDATAMCTVPAQDEMTQLYQAYPSSGVLAQHGWPIGGVYRTSTLDPINLHRYIYMTNGRVAYAANSDNVGYFVSCKL